MLSSTATRLNARHPLLSGQPIYQPAKHGGMRPTRRGDYTIFSGLCTAWLKSSTPSRTMRESPRSNPLVCPMLSAGLQVWISHPIRPRFACGHLTTRPELASRLLGASALPHTLQTFASSRVLSRDLRVYKWIQQFTEMSVDVSTEKCCIHNMALAAGLHRHVHPSAKDAVMHHFDTLTPGLSFDMAPQALLIRSAW